MKAITHEVKELARLSCKAAIMSYLAMLTDGVSESDIENLAHKVTEDVKEYAKKLSDWTEGGK